MSTNEPTRYTTLGEAAHAAEADPDHHEAYANDDRSYQLISAQEAADLPLAEHDRLVYTPNPLQHYTPWTREQPSHRSYTPAQEAAYHTAYSAAYRATYAQLVEHYPPSPRTGFPDETPTQLAHNAADTAGHQAAQEEQSTR